MTPTAVPTLGPSVNSTLILESTLVPTGINAGGAIILVLVLLTLFLTIAYWYFVPERGPCIKGGAFYCPQFRGEQHEGLTGSEIGVAGARDGPSGGKRSLHDSIPRSAPVFGSAAGASTTASSSNSSRGSRVDATRMSDASPYVNSETVAKVHHQHFDHSRVSHDGLSPQKRLSPGDSVELVSTLQSPTLNA